MMIRILFSTILSLSLLFSVVQAYENPWQAIEHKDFPAAEAMVRTKLQANPQDAELNFLLARLLAWQGRYEDSLLIYRQLLIQEPANSAYLLGKSQVFFWSGQGEAALGSVDKGLAVFPDSLELHRLRIQILLAKGDETALRQAEVFLSQAEQRFSPDLLADLRTSLQSILEEESDFVPSHEVEAGVNYEHLTNGYDEWKSVYFQGEWLYAPSQVIYGKTRLTDRFSLNDEELTLGTFQPLGNLYNIQLELSGSPSYEILPKYSFFAGLSRILPKKWDAAITARHSEYDTTYCDVYSANLGHYFADQRLDYTLYVGKAEDASETYTHRLQWTMFYGEGNRFAIYGAVGQETENTGEQGNTSLLTSSVRTLGLVGRHWFIENKWALNYELWYHKQGDHYTRCGGAFGIRLRF